MRVALAAAVLLTMAMSNDAGAQAAGARGRAAGAPPAAAPRPATAGPILVIDTVKGPIEIQLFPVEAPKTVEHITALAKRNFYNGLRVHRVEPGYVVQFGDPQTRDMTKRDRWGTGGSGKVIGAGEFSPKHKHVVGAVAIAHPGGFDPNDAKLGDSQMYIMLGTAPKLDGSFTVFGQVISGMDVVRKLAVPDVIKRISVKGGA
jgi:cyclophilin family peptidyl-prolyl cis-trans isomerase